MIRRPPISKLTYTSCPYTTLFRSASNQYHGFLQFFEKLDSYHRRVKYLYLRPPELDTSENKAKLRWKYAVDAATLLSKSRNHVTLSYFLSSNIKIGRAHV